MLRIAAEILGTRRPGQLKCHRDATLHCCPKSNIDTETHPVTRLPLSFALLIALSLPTLAQDSAKKDPPKATPTKAAEPKEAAPAVRPLSVTVDLTSKGKLEGTLTDTTQLQMQTSFGTASIPLSEVAGIKFASAEEATTTVVMLNGDSITGATDVKLITVETEWGTASINGPSVASMMFVPGLEWSPSTGLNGRRWSLIDTTTTPDQPQPRSTLPPQASQATTDGFQTR